MNCTNFKSKMTLPLLWETHKYPYETTLTFFEVASPSLSKENKYFVCITYKVLKLISGMFVLRAIELYFTRKKAFIQIQQTKRTQHIFEKDKE